MAKPLKRTGIWMAIAAVSALTLGVGTATLHTLWQDANPEGEPIAAPALDTEAADPVFVLASQPPVDRASALAQLANGSASLSRSRARYLLAIDRIQANQGGSAIPLLQDLADDYPAMAPVIGLDLAQAQTAAGQDEAARTTLEQLLADHGDDPATGEALYRLGQQDPARLDQLLEQFPSHPRSVEVALARLEADPYRADALPLLLVVAEHGLHTPQAGAFLLRLKNEFASQLQPEHWQLIGFGHWKLDQYADAGAAYARAPESPRNLYRAARGLQIGGEKTAAVATFNRLDQAFPEADETATGLLRLANSLPNEAALDVLDQVVDRFPDRAAEALEQQADLFAAMASPGSANAALEQIFAAHGGSETAAELRMQRAFEAAEANQVDQALIWAQGILDQNPRSEVAAQAGFWLGQWSQQQGQSETAQQVLEWVIAHHPESYYAWRSAVALGWNVGDFQTVRFETPEVQLPPQREPLPAGSETLSELYQLGQQQDAWSRWQVEFTNHQDPTVAEQFTDGLMRIGVGDNLDGIYAVSSLAWRDRPEDQAQYQQLKRQPDYWRALYPFPFVQTVQTWAGQRQLNPLLVMALIRQESRFEPAIRSVAGATGLMQVMPATAAWIQDQANFPDYNLENPEDNINLGTWYLDYTHREYDNHSLFAVASYNAGPGNVASWIGRGGYGSADEFVEQIPFPETQNYVRAVFGGYWNYLRLYDPAVAARVSQHQTRVAHQPTVTP
ncbi:tail length tape measure protein [filamentous cyanobacterium CCP5]|nr:tail length tape measure protein [filamentous cyanobacterium CCP5]